MKIFEKDLVSGWRGEVTGDVLEFEFPDGGRLQATAREVGGAVVLEVWSANGLVRVLPHSQNSVYLEVFHP